MWPFSNRKLAKLIANPDPKHLVNLCVKFDPPAPVLTNSEPEVVVGYYQVVGIACPGSEVTGVLNSHVKDGKIDWAESVVEEIDPALLPRAFRRGIEPPDGVGIWYTSGRIFFGPDE